MRDGNLEAHAPRLARRQQDLLEGLQLAQRTRPAGNGIADIELHDLLACDGTRVAHRDRGREPVVLAAQHRLVELERAVLEDAVPEAVPEGIERRVRTFQPAGGGALAELPPPLPLGLRRWEEATAGLQYPM